MSLIIKNKTIEGDFLEQREFLCPTCSEEHTEFIYARYDTTTIHCPYCKALFWWEWKKNALSSLGATEFYSPEEHYKLIIG